MRYWKKYTFIIMALFCWMGIHILWQLSLQLPSELEGKPILLQGEVVEDPVIKPQSTRFLFKTKDYGHIQLQWYRTAPPIQKGQIWQFTVRLKQPRNYKNPGGFNYERFLFFNRTQATGYVDARKETQLIYNPKTKTSIRSHIAQQIDQALDYRPHAALIKGLAVGIRDTMTDSQWALLQQTGTSHLLAISGLHIGLVSSFMFFLFSFIWRKVPRCPLFIPAPMVGAWAAIGGAFIYAMLAGFSVPTQRAFIMITVAMLCMGLRQNFKNRHILLFSAILVIIWDPFALMSASFWLSFLAVALLSVMLQQQAPKWFQFISMQWVISLGLTPLVIAYFQQISWISPLANFVAIPWASFTVVPLTLIGVFASFIDASMAQFFWLLAESALNYLQWFLQSLAAFPWAWQNYNIFDARMWLVIGMGSLLLLIPRARYCHYLGIVLLTTLFFIRPKPLNPGEFLLTVLDVGQGLAAVVQTAEHVLVYDTGMRFDTFNLAEAVIVPFLKYQGITHIDTLVLSHDNLDHTGGADYLIKHMPIAQKISGEAIRNIPIKQRCRAQQTWQWDFVNFEFIYPYQQNLESNNNSCVLKITTGEHSVLLTGDIEKEAEMELVAQTPALLQTTVLLAPHHGSLTSSTLPFIHQTQPEYVIFATGYKNRFKFPRQEVVERYQAQGAYIHDIGTLGAAQYLVTPQQVIRNNL